MAGERILVVDGGAAGRDALVNLLRSFKYDVESADSSDEALKMIEENPAYALITLESGLQGLDGYETCQAIRSLADTTKSKTPIVMISGVESDELRQKSLLVGATEFQAKSTLWTHITQVVERIIRPKELMDMKALVVVERKITRLGLVRDLKEIFQRVEGVENVEAALIKLKENKSIDLVVSNQSFQESSGIQLLGETRSTLGLDVPFILIVGFEERSAVTDFFRLGGTDCIVKPFVKEELLARVTTHVERVFLLREQREHIGQLKKLSDEKNSIIATCSHDLKTPLNAILGFTELLKDEIPDPEVLRDIKAIEKAGKILHGLVQNLIDIYQDQTFNQSGFGSVDIGKEIGETIDLNMPLAARKGISVSSVTEENLPLVRGDAFSLKRVLQNLLSNALKFTKKGGKVEVRAFVVKDKVIIEVIDNGIGISKETMSGLFKKFSLGNKTIGEESDVGLGLMIAQQIIAIHNSEITVSSEVGHGSTFAFALPIATMLNQTSEVVSKEENLDKSQDIYILVVDDDPEMLNFLIDSLEDAKYKVFSADSGDDAITSLTMSHFDILVTDLVMPDMDGGALAEAALRKYPELRVIICTGTSDIDQFVSDEIRKKVKIIKKPLEEERLLEAILMKDSKSAA